MMHGQNHIKFSDLFLNSNARHLKILPDTKIKTYNIFEFSAKRAFVFMC